MNHSFNPKYFLLSIGVVGLQYAGFAQCDPAAIYANDSTSAYCFETINHVRKCYTNDLPDHAHGPFGGMGAIVSQEFDYSMCLYPELGNLTTTLFEDTTSPQCSGGIVFGVSNIGINYSPFARLYFINPNTAQENLNFHVEAEFILTMDTNGGHVNTLGRYHYHRPPLEHFVNDLNIDGTSHSPLLGYAADGFPIYYNYLYTDPANPNAGIASFQSSYALKNGSRPGNGITAPNGPYDGSYYEDYEYVPSLSDLDECGGRFGITPDHPGGTYYYVLTDNWPYIPRCLKGTVVDNSFRIGPNCPSSTAVSDCSVTPVGINSLELGTELSLFPNPTRRFLQIDLDEQVKSKVSNISIYSSTGGVVYSSSSFIERITVDHLTPGSYFIQVDMGSEQVTEQFLIQ